MHLSYITGRPVSSVGHPEGALALICLWVCWHDWLMLMGCVVKMMLLPEEFSLLQCACQFFWTGHSNSCMFMINGWSYIINWHGSHAWYGCWPIKALVEAEILWWLYCELPGHSIAFDHSQTFRCLNIINNYKTSIKPLIYFIRGKCFADTGGVHIHHLWLSNKPSLSDFAKTLLGKKCLACLMLYTSAS